MSKKSNNLTDSIRKVAIRNIKEPPNDLDSLLHFLRRWWCKHYNRPFKDPLLDEYTPEELILEFFEVSYIINAEERRRAEAELFGDEEEQEYEEWLKKKMGDNYMSRDEMMERLNKKKVVEEEPSGS